MTTRKGRIFWPLLVTMFLADCTTKRMAEEHLGREYVPKEVFGDAVRLTLAYNPGMATGITFGPYSRVALTGMALICVALLFVLFRRASNGDRWLAAALGLVIGGALGNLIDRVRSTRGVVDFIDVGVGAHRFWTFNIADVGITIGALLLAVVLWRRDHRPPELAEASEGAVLPSEPEGAT